MVPPVRNNLARSTERGFTLVELLVVIGIIAILTAIAVPMFLSQRQKANDATLRSDMKGAALQVEAALLDYGGYTALNEAANNVFRPGNSGTTIYLNRESGGTDPGQNAVFWNDTGGKLPQVAYTEGTTIQFIHIKQDLSGSRWAKFPSDYDYCLMGSRADGKEFIKGNPADGAKNYGLKLYYDNRLGGLVTMKEIAPAVKGKTDVEAAKVSSCHAYGLRYIDAGGQ